MTDIQRLVLHQSLSVLITADIAVCLFSQDHGINDHSANEAKLRYECSTPISQKLELLYLSLSV